MGKPIFITDPAVAAQYHVHPAEFAWIADDVEAAWLVVNHHGYPLNYGTALPAAYYVHADAPAPFVPFPDLDPPDTQRANITLINQLSFIEDFDVEVAQTAFIADPIVGVIQDEIGRAHV